MIIPKVKHTFQTEFTEIPKTMEGYQRVPRKISQHLLGTKLLANVVKSKTKVLEFAEVYIQAAFSYTL